MMSAKASPDEFVLSNISAQLWIGFNMNCTNYQERSINFTFSREGILDKHRA